MASEAVVGAVKAIQEDQKTDEEPVLQLKDFVWDQFLKYISSAILALTILNVSVEFLRGGGVLCFPPPVSKDLANADSDELGYTFSVRQADYFNGYCSRSIPPSEFFPLYILVHGILLIAPHFIWSAVFKGDFDSFFAVTRKLDRLRDRSTGEYDPTNFDRVEKLELEFGGKRKKIFLLYIGKLLLQFAVCIGSYIFSAVFFINFSFAFDCPQDFSETNIPKKWPLNTTIPCVYTSLRVLSLVRYADYILLGLAMLLILLGLLWCVIRHTKELGHRDVANFVFQSCLSTKTYVFPPFHEIRSSQHRSDNCWFCCFPFTLFKPRSRGCIGCQTQFMLFSPRIQNDLDFFEMYLFRADTSHGRVFKEIQIDKVLRKLRGEDHQLLHLFLDAQRDMNAQMREREFEESRRRIETQNSRATTEGESRRAPGSQENEEANEGEQTEQTSEDPSSPSVTQSSGDNAAEETAVPPLSRVRDLDYFFKMGPGGFSRNPEKFAFVQLQKYLSNIKWRPVEGIRDRLYGFVMYSPKHEKGDQAGEPKTNMALDISFGSSGYALVLARAFKKVISVNFHPFFRNEKEPVKKRAFYTNYVDVNMPVDIFTQDNVNITKHHGKLSNCAGWVYKLYNTTKDWGICATDKMFEHMRKPKKAPADFLVVGPLEEDSKIVTVTLTIEMLHTVKLIEEGAVLLAVRPLRIGHRNMTKVFCKYEPPIELFDHNFHKETVLKDLKEEIGDEEVLVDGFPGIRVKCGDTNCIFEFVTYKYKGKAKQEEDGGAPMIVSEQPVPNNDIHVQPKHVTRSYSMPPQHYGVQHSYAAFPQQQFQFMYPPHSPHPAELGYQPSPQDTHMYGHSRPLPVFRRSNTHSGPFPEYPDSLQSVFSPPGVDMPNNDRQLSGSDGNEVQTDSRSGHGVAVRGGRGLQMETWSENKKNDPGIRSRGRLRGSGMTGRGLAPRGGQGDTQASSRHRSGSSGFMSPHFESMSEEDPSSQSGSIDQPDLDLSTHSGQ